MVIKVIKGVFKGISQEMVLHLFHLMGFSHRPILTMSLSDAHYERVLGRSLHSSATVEVIFRKLDKASLIEIWKCWEIYFLVLV